MALCLPMNPPPPRFPKQCLPGWRTPNSVRPGFAAMRGSIIVLHDYGYSRNEYPPHLPISPSIPGVRTT